MSSTLVHGSADNNRPHYDHHDHHHYDHHDDDDHRQCLACDNVTGLFLPPAANTSETDYQ